MTTIGQATVGVVATEPITERQDAAEGFYALANLIFTGTIPIPQGATVYRHRCTVEEVQQFAAKHGVEAREYVYEGQTNWTAALVVGHCGIYDVTFNMHCSVAS